LLKLQSQLSVTVTSSSHLYSAVPSFPSININRERK